MKVGYTCAGCGGETNIGPELVLFDSQEEGPDEWHRQFCTDACLHRFARKHLLERQPAGVDPELVAIAAADLFHALDGVKLDPVTDDADADAVYEAWGNLGITLRYLVSDLEAAQDDAARERQREWLQAQGYENSLEGFSALIRRIFGWD